jgi:hypothetical protein
MEAIKNKQEIIDDQIVNMLKKEDYYKILKYRHNPRDKRAIRWQILRNKWLILNSYKLL